jgi:hypothetical protein
MPLSLHAAASKRGPRGSLGLNQNLSSRRRKWLQCPGTLQSTAYVLLSAFELQSQVPRALVAGIPAIA